MCQLRHTGAKNVIKNYQEPEPTTSQENAVRKYRKPREKSMTGIVVSKFPPYVFLNVSVVIIKNLCRYLNTELPPMRDFAFYIF